MEFRQLLSVVTFIALYGVSANLAAECDYSDAHKYDGWGWNPVARESCPPAAGHCEDRGDYPWGWNPVTLESCRLDTQVTPLVPATHGYELHLASTLPFSQNQSASLPAGTSTHYYRIELERPMALQLDGELDSELVAAIGGVYKNAHSHALKLGEPARCFTEGTFYVTVTNRSNDADRPYSINVTATDQQCVNSVARAVNNEHPDGDWYVSWATAADGTVYAMPAFWDGITAYDQNGDLLWSTGGINQIAAPDRLSDGSTAVLSYKHSLRLLDSAGEFLWTIELSEAEFPRLFTDLVANQDTIVVYNSDEVASFNSHDGSLRWRYSPQDRVDYVKVADNGKVLVHGYSDPFQGFFYLDK